MRSIKLPSWIERSLGVGSRPVPPHVFALSETGLVYAGFGGAGGKRRGGPLELSVLVSRNLPANWLASGPIGGAVRDVAVLREHIRAVISDLEDPPTEASLVIPDRWLQQVFLETGELPRSERARDEVVRWKLRQQVPFRVEDLRVRGIEVEPLDNQEEPNRLLVGFASENLLSSLEGAFAAEGVAIGHVSNVSSCFAVIASRGRGGEALLWGESGGYTIQILRDGAPILIRAKRLEGALDESVIEDLVERDLRLTFGFLRSRVEGLEIERLVVSSPGDARAWVEAARRGTAEMGIVEPPPVQALQASELERRAMLAPAVLQNSGASWRELQPLVGAASRRVA